MIKSNYVDTAFILCGGRGTRLGTHSNHLPKPMMNCNGRPFLYYVLAQLAQQGVSNFVLGTGYLKHKIRDYFGDGSSFGFNVSYSEGDQSWDTGRRLWEARWMLPDEFMILYGDNFTLFDMNRSLLCFKPNVNLTLLVTERHRGEYKSRGNVKMVSNEIVQEYSEIPKANAFDYVEIGYMLAKHKPLFAKFDQKDCNLSLILARLSLSGTVTAAISKQPYHWITDADSWRRAEVYLSKMEL